MAAPEPKKRVYPPRERTEVTEDVLVVVQRYLAEHGPTHFLTIFDYLYQMEVVSSLDRRIQDATYNYIYNHIKKNGDNSPFRRCGRGVFCLADNFDPATAPPLNRNNKAEERRRKQMYEGKVVPHICGFCKYLERQGMQEVSLKNGTCGRYEISLRDFVQNDTPACIAWRQRSNISIAREQKRAAHLYQVIQEMNLTVTGRRRAGGKVGAWVPKSLPKKVQEPEDDDE